MESYRERLIILSIFINKKLVWEINNKVNVIVWLSMYKYIKYNL